MEPGTTNQQPQNLEAEASLLGAILIDADALVKVADAVNVDDFYDPRHQRIYEAIVALYERRSPIDVLTLADQLKGAGFLDMVGGPAYLTELTNFVPTASHVEQYAEIVAQKAMRRRLITASRQMTDLGFDESKQLRDLIDEAEQTLFQVSQQHIKQSVVSLETILAESFDRLDDLHKDKGRIRGVPSGFRDLDDVLAGFQRSDLIIIAARPAMGKAQPLSAKVLTLNGWKRMGDLVLHDELASIDGQPSKVTGIFPQGKKQIYKITFSDGRATECSGDHLWRVYYRAWPAPRVLTTEKIIGMLERQRYQKRLWIDTFNGEYGHTEPLPVPPWVLGILIGEGDFASLRFSTASEQVLSRMAAELGEAYTIKHAGNYDYRIIQTAGHRRPGKLGVWPNPLKEHLKTLGLWGKRSDQKCIPELYKHASKQARLALLQGLLDADGWCEKHRTVRFATSSPQLADDVIDLARSLGAWATKKTKKTTFTYKNEQKIERMSYVINIVHPSPETLFSLPHKRERTMAPMINIRKPTILSIEPLGVKPAQCITVSHPLQLYVTDNYTVTHNTALVLNLAHNVALHAKQPVLFFSLEMGKEQLVDRLLSMESGVDAWALRTGNLTDQDFEKIGQAMGTLSEAKIFIDDTPGLTVSDLRTKARREAHKHGLGLIIVDYLQLMSGGSRFGSSDNRVQEISEISRGLKIIARELNVPVIALSQLSRSVENRSPQIPQLADLRESGCLTGDTLVYSPVSGTYTTIRQLAGPNPEAHVTAINTDTYRAEIKPVARAFSTGIKPVYRLTTNTGRTIRATGNHKFLTITGWKRLDNLQVGDHIATPRVLTRTDTAVTMSNEELALLGHLIGDGCTLPRHVLQYTTKDIDLADQVARLAHTIFGDSIQPRVSQERGWYQVYLPSSTRLARGKRNPIAVWLTRLQAFGLRSYEKYVPKEVFTQPTPSIGIFIRHLWATDGCIRLLSKNGKTVPALYYASSSLQLAQDVQSLLLRFGICARLSRHPQPGKGRDQYHVTISGKSDIVRFINEIGAAGKAKTKQLLLIATYLETTTANTNRDIVPKQVWRLHVTPTLQQLGMTTRRFQAQLQTNYCGTALYKANLSRERTAAVAQVIQSKALARLAQSDIYWDGIASITPDGIEEVFDLTIPDLHNFVANDIFVHNSIEQDADVVAFIYREEYYNPETENKNITTILIKKHRNGPTANVDLYFESDKQRFRSLDTKHKDPFAE